MNIEVPVARGHPGNPMSWDDMWQKFQSLAEARLGGQSEAVFERVRAFGARRPAALFQSLHS